MIELTNDQRDAMNFGYLFSVIAVIAAVAVVIYALRGDIPTAAWVAGPALVFVAWLLTQWASGVQHEDGAELLRCRYVYAQLALMMSAVMGFSLAIDVRDRDDLWTYVGAGTTIIAVIAMAIVFASKSEQRLRY